MGKGKKIVALGAVALGAFIAEEIIQGYRDVMGRNRGYNSVLGRIGFSKGADDMNDFEEFLQTKRVWIREQNTEYVSIKSDRGELLQGYLTYPEKESKVFVLGLHGYHANHDGDPATFLRHYVERGYNFLNVDHVASGDSEGKYVGFGLFESQDSLKWIDYLIERFGEDIKIILHGVSMGGATVCKMVDSVPPQVVLAVADCPFTNALEEFDSAVRTFGGIKNPEPIIKAFNMLNKVFAGYDLADTDNRDSVKNSKVPMLFIHGSADDFVPVSMGEELYNLCGNEKELLIVDGAKHAQSLMTDEQLYYETLDRFIDKYIK